MVASVPDLTLAGMYEELLRREGIRAMVQAQGPGYGGWGTASGLPHRVYVTTNVFITARELLRDTFGDDYLAPLPK